MTERFSNPHASAKNPGANRTKPPAVVCMAAGKSQVIVIQKAVEAGLAVIGVDQDPLAPGMPLCQEAIFLSTYEAGPIIERIDRLKSRYDIQAVLCRSSGPPVLTAACISQHLGIPNVPVKTAETVIYKSKLAAFCKKHRIPFPATTATADLSKKALSAISFPCIVKPSLSLVGKQRIRVVERPEELSAAFQAAKEVSLDAKALIQSYEEGRDVGLISVVKNKTLHPLAFVDEINALDDAHAIVGNGVAVPTILTRRQQDQVIDLAERLVRLLGIDASPFLLSCRYTPEHGPKVIEIHLDMGGDLIFDQLIPRATDCDLLSVMIRLLICGKDGSVALTFSPTAVIFGPGEGLNSEKPFRILSSSSRESLEELIITQHPRLNKPAALNRRSHAIL